MEYTQKEQAVLRNLALFRFQKEDNAPHLVWSDDEIRVFVGSIGAAQHEENLKRNQITHIVSLTGRTGIIFEEEFEYLIVEGMKDSPQCDLIGICTSKVFPFLENIKDATTGGVLVHCMQGKSRSVAVIIAYLIRYKGMGFLDSLELIREKRPVAVPNLGFVAQLRMYEKTIKLDN